MLTLLACGAAYALPIGNPADPNLYLDGMCVSGPYYDPCDPCSCWYTALSMRLGFWGDYVYNRNLEAQGGSKQGDVQTTSIYRNEGLIVLNFWQWLDLFATVGDSNFNIVTPSSSFSTRDVQSELVFAPATSYSAGLRMDLWSCDCFNFGVEAQWAGAQPSVSNFADYGNGIVTYVNSPATTYNEWQVGFAGAYRFENGYGTAFVPYVGVKVAGLNWHTKNTAFTQGANTYLLPNFVNKKTWGYAVGITATANDKAGIGVEGRWGDEKAVYANAEIRF